MVTEIKMELMKKMEDIIFEKKPTKFDEYNCFRFQIEKNKFEKCKLMPLLLSYDVANFIIILLDQTEDFERKEPTTK